MPADLWDSADIIDRLREYDILRLLLIDEIERIASVTGRRFVPDANFDEALKRCASRYQTMLDNWSGHYEANGAAAAVKAMFLIMHQEYLDPVFQLDPTREVTESFTERLLTVSSRGLVAHNFCFKFLGYVGMYYFGIDPAEDALSEVDALIEVTVRNFEGNTNYSFEQMQMRAFKHHAPWLRSESR